MTKEEYDTYCFECECNGEIPMTHPSKELGTAIFKQPSVFNGEVAIVTFHVKDKKVGELWGTGGKLSFTGDADASAKVFFDNVIELNRVRLQEDKP